MKVEMLAMGLLLALCLVSCHKETRPFEGSYSYKIAGDVCRLVPNSQNNGYDTLYQLVSQRGQMSVMRDEQRGGNHLLVTLNEMNGGVSTLQAHVRGDSIFFDPYQFVVSFPLSSSLSSNVQSTVYQITSSGSGIQNDGRLLMKHRWSGAKVADERAFFRGENMTFVAERN